MGYLKNAGQEDLPLTATDSLGHGRPGLSRVSGMKLGELEMKLGGLGFLVAVPSGLD